MSDMDTEAQRMSAGEIALVREIVWWRRNHGILFHHFMARWVESATGRAVTYTDDGEIGVTTDYHSSLMRWIRVDSVTQAVDVLVAYGYLPARFSSAYEAGWDAASVWQDESDYGSDEFKRLFHDPENVSFPVGYLR